MKKKRVVIVGAGFGGVYTYLHLKDRLEEKSATAGAVDIVLINPQNYFLFTPLLHEVATGSIPPEHTTEPLRKILGCCHNELLINRVSSVSLLQKKVFLGKGGGNGEKEHELDYDVLVLAAGSRANLPRVPGADKASFTLKTMEDAVRLKNRLIEVFEKAVLASPAEQKEMLSFIIIGGGPTGVELAAEMADLIYKTFARHYHANVLKNVSITLLHKDPALLSSFSSYTQRKSKRFLEKKGVRVILKAGVIKAGDNFVEIEGGKKIKGETIVWAGGVSPVSLSFDKEVKKSSDGRLLATPNLSLPEHPEVFVLGDVAFFADARYPHGLPPLAQVAVAEAKTVAKNIEAYLFNKKPKTFNYRPKGELVSLGQWMAAGRVFGLPISGALAWWIWRTIYLHKIISTSKKFKVALDWTINIFLPRDISELYRP